LLHILGQVFQCWTCTVSKF